MSTNLAQPIDFHPATADVPTILLPDARRIFARRAGRFMYLAENHPLADWLHYLGHLTQCQREALDSRDDVPLPNAERIDQARQHGMPPLNAASLVRPVIWQTMLRRLIDCLTPSSPLAAQARMKALRAAPPDHLEALASALLNGHPSPDDLADLPLVAAALQTLWTTWAAQLDSASLAVLDAPGLCPCCGSLPVASVVRVAPNTMQVNNLRYLHCSLCNTEWNVPRTVCTACTTDKDISYQQIEGSNGAARAECCDACNSYLKLFMQEKDADVDPVADDLATLALDLLVDEAGYARSGPNLLLLGGAS